MFSTSDKELVIRVATQHDPESFQLLYQRYGQEIHNFLFHRLPQKEDAEDITAQVFLKAWEYLTSGKGKEVYHFRGFLYKIARNEVSDWYRAKGKIPPLVALDKPGEYGDYVEVPDAREDLFIRQLQSEDKDYLIKCVQQLKTPYLEIIALRYFEELDIKEITEVVGKKPGHIRVLIHRGVKELKNIMLRNRNIKS